MMLMQSLNLRRLIMFGAALLFCSIGPARAQDGALTTLYAFPDYSGGSFPIGGLSMDTSGALYGTTQYGGLYQNSACGDLVPPCGTIFKLTPAGAGTWSYQLLHTMTPAPIQGYNEDGERPVAPLAKFQNVFYGVNSVAGDTQCGCGNIFSITPNGTYTILHVFDPFVPGANDINQWPNGTTPIGGLLIDSNGTMYGTTSAGGTGGALGPDGTNGAGVLYQINPNGSGFQVLHNFDGSLNAGPQGELIFGQDGAIYGTQFGGGKYNQGVIFRMTKDGSTYQVLYDFLGNNQPGNSHDGAGPKGRLALGPDGTIYGTTELGGDPSGDGTAWSIKDVNGQWQYTQLYVFNKRGEGSLPNSGVVLIGNELYGTTTGSGPYGGGTIYKLVPAVQAGTPWTYISLHNFKELDPNGNSPSADLLFFDGMLYGANISGGNLSGCSHDGCGTVFAFSNPVPHDFNADGRSDILWRDTSGDVAMWLINGASVSQSAGVGNAPTTWSIVDQRDFNGDGKADILWHDTSGNVAMWLMNGGQVSQSLGVGKASTAWSVAGTGDFFGNGNGDILWRDSSGNVALWELSGGAVTGSCGVGNAPTSWTIAGTGDFDGSGTADILWRDASGNVAIWFMNGCTVTQSSGVGNAPTTWTIAGTGDFDGNGKSDILWHDTSGNVAIWFMNAAAVAQSAGVGNAPTVWSIAQTGDYYGAGTSDILWRDTSGDVAVWEMNGATVTQSAGIGNAPTVWSIQGAGAD